MRRLLTERGVATRAPGSDGAVVVGGAGLHTPGGRPAWPPVTQWLAEQGMSTAAPSGLSRRLTPQLLAEADLVLVATRALRDELVSLAPAAMAPTVLRRTFTWRELAWLLQDVDPASVGGDGPVCVGLDGPTSTGADDAAARIRLLPAVAAGRRGHLAAPPGEQFDVADPVSGDVALEDAAAAITDAIRTIVEVALPRPAA